MKVHVEQEDVPPPPKTFVIELSEDEMYVIASMMYMTGYISKEDQNKTFTAHPYFNLPSEVKEKVENARHPAVRKSTIND